MTDSLQRPRRLWLRRFALLLASCLFSFGLLEVALRITGFEYPVTTVRDENRGFASKPDNEWIQRTEGYAVVTTNRFGFRDNDWSVPKPDDTIRIAVLGDSFTEGSQVSREHRFTERLEDFLHARDVFQGRDVEVMNFGVSGYGTAQELMTFRHGAKQFSPDFVILAFLTGNDIRNNSEKLERDPIRPYFVERNGELTLDDSFRQQQPSLTRRIGLSAARYSRLAQMAYRVHHAVRGTQKLQAIRESSPTSARIVDEGLAEPGLSTWVYQAPHEPHHQQAWSVTERIVTQLRNEVRESGARLLIVTLSNAIQVHPDASRRKLFCDLVEADSLFYPDSRIAQLCRREQIPLVSLAPSMQRYAEENKLFLHGFENTVLGQGHWNEEGHLIASQLIGHWFLPDTTRNDGVMQVSAENRSLRIPVVNAFPADAQAHSKVTPLGDPSISVRQ